MTDIGCDLLDPRLVDPEVILGQLRHLGLGPDVEAILSPDVPAAAVPFYNLVAVLTPSQLVAPHALDHLVEQLVAATSPGGPLDPKVIGVDVVWVQLLVVLLDHDPAVARAAAVRWVRQLDELSTGQDHVASAVVAAVAAYCVSAAEEALGRPIHARRWAREADAHVECEGAGVSVAAWARAGLLLGRGGVGAYYGHSI